MSECAAWSAIALEERIRRVCALRHVLAEDPDPFVDLVQLPFRRTRAETLAGELIPLADACEFLERSALKILRPRRLGASGRPLWLFGVDATIEREPLGTVLIVGPRNYPLMLSGIQAVQALVCGNRVLWKPAPGTKPIASLLAETLVKLGVLPSALIVLDEEVESVPSWLDQVDKVFLTGSQPAGRAVMRMLAERLIPSVMELSGSDPVVVLPDADLDLVAHCVRFGLTFNGSASCIAPRRILVEPSQADRLAEKLVAAVSTIPPLALSRDTQTRLNELGRLAITEGATLIAGQLPCQEPATPLLFDFVRPEMTLLHEDLMAPVASLVRVSNTTEALAVAHASRFQLGASIFGSIPAAQAVARRIESRPGASSSTT